MVQFLIGESAAALTHDELEDRLECDGRALICQLLQDHLDLRAAREQAVSPVLDEDGRCHNAIESGHRRHLETIFGSVIASRLAYRADKASNLHLLDAALNLPAERYSHGLRRRAAIEAARGSYEEARASLERSSGVVIGKRQLEQLAARSAVDFEHYYAARQAPRARKGEVVVISCDGKGVVMRPESLRPQTKAAGARQKNKLHGRLSKGEKANRKRMAEVGAVYSVVPKPRTPEQVMAPTAAGQVDEAPKAADKWVTASVADDASTVIANVFEEASRRDPDKVCDWVALVDGNCHQIERITAEASARGIVLCIVVDFVHVLEYLWKAAWSFYREGDPAAEEWVQDKALEILGGKASIVAAAIRRKATMLRLDPSTRRNADLCSDYLLAKAAHLDYPTALAKGWPIATGVIEGACRHVVKDRMDITGARWGLQGAEAVLKLRALRTNGDFEDYWSFHLAAEHGRVHASRYFAGVVPAAA
ncbi:MAG TPA: ISKra4 family transposase [Acidimicrobiales bacterium]|nr:ISKra4 family transposase [Acidimicrobiales bacterium]